MRAVLCFLWLLTAFVPSAGAEQPTYPALNGQVVDEAGVLTPQQKAAITRVLASDSDNQIVVAIVNDLRGQEGREYGIELARRWQLGQKGKDNGVLMLFAVKERYAGIEVGYGLEEVLPDSLSGRILREKIIPPLRQKNADYGQAALNGAIALQNVLSDGVNRQAEATDPAEDLLSLFLTLIFVFLVLSGRLRGAGAVGHFLGRGSRGGGFRGGGGGFGGGGAGGRF